MRVEAPRSAFSGNGETQTITLHGHEWEIDSPLTELVIALARPGIHVFSGEARRNSGPWSVNFSLERDRRAWNLLDQIALAVAKVPGAKLQAWYNGDFDALQAEEGGSDFELHGDGEFSADEMAQAINLILGKPDATPE